MAYMEDSPLIHSICVIMPFFLLTNVFWAYQDHVGPAVLHELEFFFSLLGPAISSLRSKSKDT